ncbi:MULTISPECIES: class IV lanthionine synthetase LanL [Streptomyces]|uniref:class IV lanthionine synthetase LanL n=1 Tax=Streptomyces TaxID=1883 RepID=UPI00099DB6EA|nr:class IV lanthionine synthetase LanL [Streptomyces virginiae]
MSSGTFPPEHSAGDAEDAGLLQRIARWSLDGSKTEWALDSVGFWSRATPSGLNRREQGWKLHLSATPLSAPIVLSRVVEVISQNPCAFKFASSLGKVESLVHTRCARGSSGKFITIYPNDDDQFESLAQSLHSATFGLPGPVILSDLPYRPGSLVQYRFGAFVGVEGISNEGNFEVMLRGPGGELVEDRRDPWFNPPKWAGSPPVPSPAQDLQRPGGILLAQRFRVTGAIQQSNKGGVFLAEDEKTSRQVVIKRARQHIGATLNGVDAADILRSEAAMLDRLEGLGLTPRKVALFERGGDTLLAQERICGKTLSRWVREVSVSEGDVFSIAGELVDMVASIHDQGLVLRDLTPNNVMVADDGRLQLIDVECITEVGEVVTNSYTREYAAPEQIRASRIGYIPEQAIDLYAMGGMLFFLATGVHPNPASDDDSSGRCLQDRWDHTLGLMAQTNPILRALSPAVRGLLADSPDERWPLTKVKEYLQDCRQVIPHEVSDSMQITDAEIRRIVDDGLAHIAATMGDPRQAQALWSQQEKSASADPSAVQYGAAGVMASLVHLAAHLRDAQGNHIIGQTASWIERRLENIPRTLPGLYFGSAGTAWALHDAATLLQNEHLAKTAEDLALKVPIEWPNPDVAHGAAGAGITQFYFWRRTGDGRYLERMEMCAAKLATEADHTEDGVFWHIPADFNSTLAGLTHYGFAHGVAGIGYFFLLAHRATQSERYLSLAREAGNTLLRSVSVENESARWPTSRIAGAADNILRTYWCSGSSGIGSFLLQLWEATGEPDFLDMAKKAAQAVHEERWQGSSGMCHGLAGNGDFLLDLADMTGLSVYREQARDIATVIHARSVIRNGLTVVCDDSQTEVTVGYSTGISGIICFLSRLLDGGPRLWMPN